MAPATPPRNPGSWTQRALPIVISLVDDVRAAEADTADPTQADPARLQTDDSRLQADLASAERLEPSPAWTMRPVWTSTLGRLSLGDRALHAAAGNLDPAAVTLAHQLFSATGDSLLRMGRAMTPGS
jgi:hypothetical protein